ncbi:MAG: primosomal protein N' [Pseudomonadota bacterium]
MKQLILRVALDTPLDFCFDYAWQDCGDDRQPETGQLVVVPFGRREVVGVIIAILTSTDVAPHKLKLATLVRSDLAPLATQWRALCMFASDYYQRPLGEVMLPGLPKSLRTVKPAALKRALAKAGAARPLHDATPTPMHALTPAQNEAASAIAASTKARGFAPILLYGVTGSGKTEVYLQATTAVLTAASSDGSANCAQVLILVPEINLTPQLEGNIRARFPEVAVASLHSGLAEGERLAHWLAAHLGHARIVLGTRLAILASLPNLKLIIIDEEHDPSYKQQEGLRYSARDLAVWRAHQLEIPIVLGSATPSLETWHHAQAGRYRKLVLRERAATDAVLPVVRLIDTERDKPVQGLTSTLIAALKLRLERGEQSLLFLNRRGYAPVVACQACGWISNCSRCTAFMVLHKLDRQLRCHHCGLEHRIPRHCPTCGNVDIEPMGRGTQRIEESLQAIFPEARVLRIDADSTRRKGTAQAAFLQVHRGEVDILIGTQMVAKGHDFQNLTLVGVLNPDMALFSQDYRAGERLFAQLMQVAGRAGRRARTAETSVSEVLIQTRYPQHPLFAAVMAHDYDGFAGNLLAERQQAGLPPFIYQAMLRAEAKELALALDFLRQASTCTPQEGIIINDPIPMTMTRIANIDRAQLLVESVSRPALQAFLKKWIVDLRMLKSRVRWSLEVDPVDI